jgi:hypothetical protein
MTNDVVELILLIAGLDEPVTAYHSRIDGMILPDRLRPEFWPWLTVYASTEGLVFPAFEPDFFEWGQL